MVLPLIRRSAVDPIQDGIGLVISCRSIRVTTRRSVGADIALVAFAFSRHVSTPKGTLGVFEFHHTLEDLTEDRLALQRDTPLPRTNSNTPNWAFARTMLREVELIISDDPEFETACLAPLLAELKERPWILPLVQGQRLHLDSAIPLELHCRNALDRALATLENLCRLSPWGPCNLHLRLHGFLDPVA